MWPLLIVSSPPDKLIGLVILSLSVRLDFFLIEEPDLRVNGLALSDVISWCCCCCSLFATSDSNSGFNSNSSSLSLMAQSLVIWFLWSSNTSSDLGIGWLVVEFW